MIKNNLELSFLPTNSHAVLIGTSTYDPESGYENIEGVKHNLKRVIEILCDSKIIGLPEKNISAFHNIENPAKVYKCISELTESLDLFILYYAGHGSINNKNNSDLLLTTSNTLSKNAQINSIEYSKIKELISDIPAKTKIVFIDSCFSGIATDMFMSNGVEEITQITGATVISSTGTFQLAFGKRDGSKYTAFSSLLITTLENGLNNGKPTITLSDLYSNIVTESRKANFPIPKIKTSIDVVTFHISYNTFINKDIPQKKISKLKKLLLVKTASKFPVKNFDFGVPLGLFVLKSYLRRYGIEADVYDERLNLKCDRSDSFPYIINDYDIIGISICSSELQNAIQLLRQAKQQGKITVVGGIFAYTNEEYLLSYDEIDYVIPGVATKPLQFLIDKLSRNGQHKITDISGVYCSIDNGKINWKGGNPIWTPDTIPFIDKPVFEELINEYQEHLEQKIDIVTSRGCYFRCEFCSIQKECLRTPRTRNDSDVVDNIEYLTSKGFKTISIKDEIFPIELNRCRNILINANKKTFGGVNFKIKSRLDIIRREKDLLKFLSVNKVSEIQYGVESLNQQMLAIIKKNAKYSFKELKNFFTAHKDLGIIVNASFIIGIEGEDEDYYDYFLEAITELNDENIKFYFNFYTPHPFKSKWNISSASKLLNDDLSCFTHKIPIITPSTIGTRNQRQKMLQTYEDVVNITKSRQYNLEIPHGLKDIFLTGTKDFKNKDIRKY